MDYQLARQLKDAGFPQDWLGQCPTCYSYDSPYPDPTLSELIKACGYGFRELIRHTEYNTEREEKGLSKLGRVWTAKAGKWAGGFITNGFSPEEALAKLWIKLNKK